MYQSVRVRLPNQEVRSAELTSSTKNGYRAARVQLASGVKLRGRVTARHGFSDDRILPLEVNAADAWMLAATAATNGKNIYLK